MEFSERWLKEWVNLEINTITLCEQLTESGLEVESVKCISGVFNDVIIGKVISCEIHPNDNMWKIFFINIGCNNNIHIISKICNVKIGMKVVIAPIGSILPDKIVIKPINIEGYISEGIICSFFDLGMFEYGEKIIVLPDNAPVGVDLHKYFLLNDNIIKLSVTPNRFDCLGILGIARELYIRNNIKLPVLYIKPVKSIINDTVNVILKAPNICPRYFCRLIKNISNSIITPIWMVEKLRRSNIKSINAIVDIVEYVSIELGLPLHVFNADITVDNIILRKSSLNEKTTLINKEEIILDKNVFVISNNHSILSVEGNINTVISEVTTNTKNILVGSAFLNISLDEKVIGKYTGKNFYTNCYEYGVDFNLQEYAIEYVTNLLMDIVGGQSGPLVSETDYSNFCISRKIKLSRDRLNKVLGFFMEDDLVKENLLKLGFRVIWCSSDYWQVESPSWRFDIKIEEDVIGELVRIYGYNNISSISYVGKMFISNINDKYELLKKTKNLLVNKGFYEIITYSFIDPNMQSMLFPNRKQFFLSNPISKEMSSMRTSLLPGLLNILSYNQDRQRDHICLFESGLCFLEDKNCILGVSQNFYLSGIAYGYIYGNRFWDKTDKRIDFFDMKGVIESIFEINGILKNIDFRSESITCLHVQKSANIYCNGKLIGYFGVLNSYLSQYFKYTYNVVMFEIFWENFLSCDSITIKKFSRFPNSKRDISIIVSKNVPINDIIKTCKDIDIIKIVDVYIFDLYCDSRAIMKNKKSVGVRLIFEDMHKTLIDSEINVIVKKCILKLQKKFQAVLRN
ncbi:phenylalanine--tRNA ligase subunit beta [Buchnera aphidicola (Formosaphis micheliae)]|uniref:phenylalanine--tRNA ligase subunit beta n=1 Tax=Buchnera aphidicola TaxID=9 RepID=UPI0031CC6328